MDDEDVPEDALAKDHCESELIEDVRAIPVKYVASMIQRSSASIRMFSLHQIIDMLDAKNWT